MEVNMDFRLAEHGQVFSTRPRGLELRQDLESALAPDEVVAVSFTGVHRVSQSFSDEFLGALLTNLGTDRVAINGEVSPAVARVLTRMLKHRGVDGRRFAATH